MAITAAALILAGCSAITPLMTPEKGVPPAPEGLTYPSVGHAPPHPGQPVLSAEQRKQLENDLDRYKIGQ